MPLQKGQKNGKSWQCKGKLYTEKQEVTSLGSSEDKRGGPERCWEEVRIQITWGFSHSSKGATLYEKGATL